MPVENHVHAKFRTPLDGLVESLMYSAGVRSRQATGWMGMRTSVRAHFLHLHEMLLAPVPLHFELVGIGDRQSAENHRFPVGIDELVSFDRDPRQLLGPVVKGRWPGAGSRHQV